MQSRGGDTGSFLGKRMGGREGKEVGEVLHHLRGWGEIVGRVPGHRRGSGAICSVPVGGGSQVIWTDC